MRMQGVVGVGKKHSGAEEQQRDNGRFHHDTSPLLFEVNATGEMFPPGFVR
ncbi:hypothetical protein ACVSQB_34970 [Bradyrhizobium elkanii]